MLASWWAGPPPSPVGGVWGTFYHKVAADCDRFRGMGADLPGRGRLLPGRAERLVGVIQHRVVGRRDQILVGWHSPTPPHPKKSPLAVTQLASGPEPPALPPPLRGVGWRPKKMLADWRDPSIPPPRGMGSKNLKQTSTAPPPLLHHPFCCTTTENVRTCSPPPFKPRGGGRGTPPLPLERFSGPRNP